MKKLFSLIWMMIAVNTMSAQVIKMGNDTIATMNEVSEAYPSATSWKHIQGGVYDVLGSGRKVIGRMVLSPYYVKGVEGFSGPTPLLVAVDNQGVITKVVLLKNTETPGFINRVKRSGLFSAWDGVKMSEASDKQVDAVTGATFSSSSIIKTLRLTAKGANIKASADDDASKDQDAGNTSAVDKDSMNNAKMDSLASLAMAQHDSAAIAQSAGTDTLAAANTPIDMSRDDGNIPAAPIVLFVLLLMACTAAGVQHTLFLRRKHRVPSR
jgi:uncharacterized protein with FMN-binding domain